MSMKCGKCGFQNEEDGLFCIKCGNRLSESRPKPSKPSSDHGDITGSLILEYKLERKLGEGGMGAVYYARHQALDQEVAVKVLSPLLARNQELVDRFIQEAKIQINLRHPNVVGVLTAVTTGPHIALVMEYVDGISLGEVLVRRGPLPLDEIQQIFDQVLDVVGYAHKKGVVHRDLKPSNIMVTADGTAKVMDFGIAKVLGADRMTRTGTTMGSAHYMAPEQILGRADLDHRADIYALGITLFEMVTGKPPFDQAEINSTDSDFLIKQAHVQTQAPDAKDLRPEIPELTASAIRKAMAKEPASRFQSCEAFRQALGADEGPATDDPEQPPRPLVQSEEPSVRAIVPIVSPHAYYQAPKAITAHPQPDPITGLLLASYGQRLVASFLDTAIWIIPMTLLIEGLGSEIAGAAAFSLLFAIYEGILLQLNKGQTWGKQALRLKVVNLEGEDIDSRAAWFRAATRAIFGMAGISSILNVIAIFFGGKRRCIHDYAATTVVIQLSKKTQEETRL